MPQWYDWINKEIRNRLASRFELAEEPRGRYPFVLLRHVQPITNFDDLLQDETLDMVTLDLTGAGWVNAWTIPKGKRWRLLALSSPTQTAASGMRLNDGTNTVNLFPTLGQTAGDFKLFGHEYILKEDWLIDVIGSGNAGDGARVYAIWYIEEDAYRGGV